VHGTRFYDLLALHIPRSQLNVIDDYSDFYPALKDGTCNVVASTFVNLRVLGLQHLQDQDNLEYVSGEGYYTTEPLSIATQKDDQQWIDFCKYAVLSLIAAEFHNITSGNVLSIHQASTSDKGLQPRFHQPAGFGDDYKDMFIDAVAAVGNYGEMGAKRVNPVMMSREKNNYVNDGTTGLIRSFPFGQVANEGPSLDDQFPILWSRGKIRCGIRAVGRPGFAERIEDDGGTFTYSGMDVDYCLAIAASIFNTIKGTVDFIEVQDEVHGFDLLHSGEVDVLAGVTGDLESDIRDRGTGVGYSFSSPYFYGSFADGTETGADANLCLATTEDNHSWSAFVFWIVQATFFAEESQITRLTANQMPTIHLYGPRFTRIFRDAISAVGSYGELHEWSLECSR